MSKKDEALKLALGYMDGTLVTDHLTGYELKRYVMEAIRGALAEQPTIPCGDSNPGLQWDKTPQAFNDWWDSDYDPTGNPFRQDSAAYWAWAGWKAATEQPAQQEPVAVFDEQLGRPKMLPNAPMLTHGQELYTPPQTAQREPVARIQVTRRYGKIESWGFVECPRNAPAGVYDVYTSPQPSKPWVGLNLDDRERLRDKYEDWNYPSVLLSEVENILREKNQ